MNRHMRKLPDSFDTTAADGGKAAE